MKCRTDVLVNTLKLPLICRLFWYNVGVSDCFPLLEKLTAWGGGGCKRVREQETIPVVCEEMMAVKGNWGQLYGACFMWRLLWTDVHIRLWL